MKRAVFLFAAGCVAAAGQADKPVPERATLQYDGKPLTVPFHCTDEDMNWAGLSCSEDEPCPVYLELAGVEAAGNRVAVIGNIHSATVTLYSILLTSDDAGRTWREGYDRVRGAGLDHIQLLDFENGWISGQALSPLPQDPFLLITSDGGKSWRQRALFSDSRVGSILQFWFTSKSSGSLIVDRGQGGEGSRYELYESPNAGETWMVRETSDKPLKLKRGPAAIAAWRIRTDAPTQSFRIERQGTGERWTAVAAFAVPIGACVPAPPKEPAEPSAGAAEAPADAVPVLVVPSRPGAKRPPK
jgi:hypothetical protein